MADDNKNQNQTTQNPADAGQGGNQNQQSQQAEPKTLTMTQEELDRIITERLKRERQKYADYDELKKAAEELKKLKEAQMSEQEKLQARLAEYERKTAELEIALQEARLEATKLRVLEEIGLPKTFASRIFGTTEEEIRQDAQELAKLLNANRPIGNPSNPPNNNQPTFTRAQLAQMSPEEINANWEAISRALTEGRVK
ncbi:putative prophage lambdach01, scaffold protein [Desulfofundulus kuznetsovii DSM 6115]|uniref:Prophage lambdach01, scaffold protein n=1 Tax=Desulfofundulus kuznetsovii (strain DSM 6115 / VKM B-1805 / 17) TaxID=760568 RepID=A0AAU8PBL3_DESK7|nr:putative prophage lambdach01, scaffold protein [Desulfofundulus kuznetsovii DSM 6115]